MTVAARWEKPDQTLQSAKSPVRTEISCVWLVVPRLGTSAHVEFVGQDLTQQQR